MAQNLKINILAQDKTKQAFNGIRGRLDKLKSAVFSVRGALVGIGAGVVVKSFVDTGRSIEDLQVRLKQLFGSTQEGAKAFDVMANFASKVPFSLEQIQEASGNLAVVAGDADRLAKILEITGNVASVTGIDFRTAGEQIQRSFAGGIASADIFREKGVRDMLGFKAGATVTAEETIKAFERVFGKDGKFGNATDELANTFTGTLSMLGDKLFNFKKNVANAEFFSALKGEFKDLNKFIEENADDFETISEVIGSVLTGAVKLFSISVKGVATAVGGIRDAYEGLLNLLNKIPGIDIHFINKQQREILRDLQNYEDSIMRIGKAQEEVNVTLAKGTKEVKKQKQEYKNIHQAYLSHKKQIETSNHLHIEIHKKLKEQNKEFSLSDEIFDGITSSTKSFSKSLAESLVLGKSLNMSFRELAQNLLINLVSKTIERIALLGIEKLLLGDIVKKEEEKDNLIRKQNTNLKRQIILNTLTGGSGGGSFFGSLFGRASGGSVQKGQPYMVGEQGAELFVPNQSGQIQQSARGGNGGATTVNFNINTVDASGFEELLIRSRGTITQLINNAVNERGSRNII